MQAPSIIRLLPLLTALVLCSMEGLGETVRIAGSDFAGKVLGYHSKQEKQIGDYTADYQMTGSYLGLLKLKNGFADIAFILQSSKGQPDLSEFTTVPLGFWGVYFAVEASNPLNEARETDLTAILQKTRDGLKSEWGSLLPTEPKWSNRLIFVTLDVAKSDPSFPVLLERFFENQAPDNYASLGERLENPGLAGPSNLLVLSKLPEPGSRLRTLSIIQEGQTVGFPPSSESMLYGDYSFSIALHLVVRDPNSPKVRTFLSNFFKGDSVKLLEKSGLVSVPNNVRRAALLEFDLNF